MNPYHALVLTCLLAVNPVSAHPGHAHGPQLRTWFVADGRSTFEASFVLVQDDRVQLLTADETVVWVPLPQLSPADQGWVAARQATIQRINQARTDVAAPVRSVTDPVSPVAILSLLACVALGVTAGGSRPSRGLPYLAVMAVVGLGGVIVTGKDLKDSPAMQKHFEPFKEKLKFRSDSDYFYVESEGLPDHPLMVGITSWQQQVPLPQPYTGKNAWQIPLHPKLAEKPISGKKALYRGAIALAVNGVPIFNALNNRGVDAYLAGELDEFGGHCGRADDYHYHRAPVHLQKQAGKGNPIAYALDGYPLFGYTDASGKEPNDLDEFNGRMENDGYRYYSTKKFPYVNGGLRGEVTVRNDGVEPQPRAAPLRPAGQPLRGAKITGFTHDASTKSSTLNYELRGKTLSWKYALEKDNSVRFVFVDGEGKETTETYKRRDSKEGPPPRTEDRVPNAKPVAATPFTLSSPAFKNSGLLPVEYTGDGDSVSPPLEWSNAPDGTKCFALQLWHKPFADRDEVKSYWVLYNIPATTTKLPKNAKAIGQAGVNDKNRTDYDPMKSKGPGVKEYHITMYALSAEPKFKGEKVTRTELIQAVKDITLAESTLSFKYERTAK
ncbi:YHYH protein [soil metagenome]